MSHCLLPIEGSGNATESVTEHIQVHVCLRLCPYGGQLTSFEVANMSSKKRNASHCGCRNVSLPCKCPVFSFRALFGYEGNTNVLKVVGTGGLYYSSVVQTNTNLDHSENGLFGTIHVGERHAGGCSRSCSLH